MKRTLVSLMILSVLATGCGKVHSYTDVYERELVIEDDQSAGGQIVFEKEPEEEPVPEKLIYDDEKNGVSYCFRAEEKYLSVYDGESFNPVYLNGINIGSGYPGHYPGELAITKDVYFNWFEKIAGMNCNCIRVYTMMMPDFYDALYEYNLGHDKKLYMLMGIWYNEEELAETSDAFSTLNDTTDEAKRIIDAIHGNTVIDERPGAAHGKYANDISDYVLGWIIGIETEPEIITATNEIHPDKTKFDGKYLRTAAGKEISPFDVFLCEFTDGIIAYESETYHMQRPVSWVNWPTTDPLEHPVEPYSEWEDAEAIDVEHIQAKDSFPAGTFASYHVYPYYPEFMMLEDKYTGYRDASGKINTYEAYVKEITSYHSIPVLIAEYGVPTSRGCTNVNKYMHYDQGHITEEEQGEYLASMAQSIYDSGCCGGLAFSWQDEWFKRTWNTMDYSDPNRRAFWSDVQTSEQNYGVVSFDPGTEKTVVQIDGEISDWEDAPEVAATDFGSVLAKSDARYLYLCVKRKNLNLDKDRIVIPIDITPKSGMPEYDGHYFDIDADFVLDINGRDNTRILVHSYYDRYAFAFGAYDNLFESGRKKRRIRKNSKDFVPIYLCISRKQVIKSTGETIDAERIETGVLQYGNGTPFSEDYNSLSDFYSGDDFVEFRIPWGLLNFRDPSTKQIEDDFWINKEQQNLEIEGIKIGISMEGKASASGDYTWDNWQYIDFHERPKTAYYTLGDKYEELKLE